MGREPRIVFEDDDLIVVDKPAGWLTIATASERARTVYARLREMLGRRRPPQRVFVVHRLDRDASGLLVFAKTVEAKHGLQEQFRRREAGRAYRVMVEGRMRDDTRTLCSYLAENAALRVYATTAERGGKRAVTHVRVLRRFTDRTLVEARLETGRKHQIRVQLADAGHPVLGDRRYGTRRTAARGIALHAASLRFRHPQTGRRLEFRCPTPRGFGVPSH